MNNKAMQSELKKIKQQLLEDYKRTPDKMVADFKLEKETAKGYNGRQILELLQNCDDEGATDVLLEIDTKAQKLTIANTGNPFSLDGYKALFYLGNSAKMNRKRFIGNKGLGFRSVLTWAESLEIISNEISLEYSRVHQQAAFQAILSEKDRTAILKKHKYTDAVAPIPYFTVPEIKRASGETSYSTSICISYVDEIEDDILTQLKQMHSELLLFLNNIQKVIVKIDTEQNTISVSRKPQSKTKENSFGPSGVISDGIQTWTIFSESGEFDFKIDRDSSENLSWEVKTAINSNLHYTDSKLFCFFPTDIRLSFPFLIHATFELDQNRNQITKNKSNKEVVKKLVDLMTKIALHVSNEEISWKPIRILDYQSEFSKNTKLDEAGFYIQLKEAIVTQPVFPCVDGQYRKKVDTVFFSDSFATFLKEREFTAWFPNHLIEQGDSDFNKRFGVYGYIAQTQVESLARQKMEDKVRAELIELLINTFPNWKFSVLINAEGEILSCDQAIFTPGYKEVSISIPEGFQINIYRKKLHDALIREFGLFDSKDKSKEIQKKLKSISDVRNFESIQICQRIISICAEKVRQLGNQHAQARLIKETVWSLFQNYRNLEISAKLDNVGSLPLIAKDGTILKAGELCLSAPYQNGELNEHLFGSYYESSCFLADPDEFGLAEEDSVLLGKFFVWLGVHPFAIYKNETIYWSTSEAGRRYLSSLETDRDIKDAKVELPFKFFDLLTTMGLENFITWLHFDGKLSALLLNVHNDVHRPKYAQSDWTNKASYVRFLTLTYGPKLSNHILEDRLLYLNETKVDYSHSTFREFKLKKTEINTTLKKIRRQG
jgi:hypothetical protein